MLLFEAPDSLNLRILHFHDEDFTGNTVDNRRAVIVFYYSFCDVDFKARLETVRIQWFFI